MTFFKTFSLCNCIKLYNISPPSFFLFRPSTLKQVQNMLLMLKRCFLSLFVSSKKTKEKMVMRVLFVCPVANDLVCLCGEASANTATMKSTKVQNPRRILHILRSMPMHVHRACAGFDQKLYACALFIIDGLGHATWSSKTPVSRSGKAPF